MKVLVIDNSSLFHSILVEAFEKSGIEPVLSETISDGQKQLERQEIDFICVSMYLPDGDGISFAKNIHANQGYYHLPIILFTSEETSEVYKKALSSGVTEVFHKKDVQQLVNFIQRFTLQQQPLSGRVLYVEDSLSQQLLVTKIFQSHGLQVDAFVSGEDAWAAYLKNDYNLVVTDVVLDGTMTGMELTNQIRRLENEKGDVPILAITGFDDISRRIELFYLGVSDYVIKPVVKEELIARVRNLIMTNRYFLESVKQQQRAEKADAIKSEFLANMSHELRTPMHGILSFASFGLKKFSDAPREKLGDYFAHIDISARRMILLLNDLLDLAKLESGKMNISYASYNLEKTINDCIYEQQARLTERNINVDYNYAVKNANAEFDAVRIAQVVTNLLSNAIKFSPVGGMIHIKLEHAKMPNNGTNGFLFSMRDEGEGIPEDQLEAVFDKFIQSGMPHSNMKGTGLGLAISKEIIENHGGRIWAEQALEGGACLSFIIPENATKKGLIK